ncbi:hypothetical protein FE257_003188 [Aspergillus nanangensis]|uniref:Uncharacterized protein n=1 Tax=Aspergillus nanangensis TaxID=2582783 RepID=A0AAD4CBS3_ASPNN|nr:hypothetical protein FE257_003188 [Aspergillus nanangensis]
MSRRWSRRLLSKSSPSQANSLPSPHLPAEIWNMIGLYVGAEHTENGIIRRTLLSLSCTCGYFRQIFQPLLFHSIESPDWWYYAESWASVKLHRIHLLFKSILKRPELGSHFREFYIRDQLVLCPSKGFVESTYPTSGDEFKWLSWSESRKARKLLGKLIKESGSTELIRSQVFWVRELEKGAVGILATLLLSQLTNITRLDIMVGARSGGIPDLLPLLNISSLYAIDIHCSQRGIEDRYFDVQPTRNAEILLEKILSTSLQLEAIRFHGWTKASQFFNSPAVLKRALEANNLTKITELSIDVFVWALTPQLSNNEVQRLGWLQGLPYFQNIRCLSIQLEILLCHPGCQSLSLKGILPAKLEELHILCNYSAFSKAIRPYWRATQCLEQVEDLLATHAGSWETHLQKISITWPGLNEKDTHRLEKLRSGSKVKLEFRNLSTRNDDWGDY